MKNLPILELKMMKQIKKGGTKIDVSAGISFSFATSHVCLGA